MEMLYLTLSRSRHFHGRMIDDAEYERRGQPPLVLSIVVDVVDDFGQISI